ncbi:MAG: hypothetical protein AAGK74_00130 [Chloroflexota bacterium]
MAATLKWRGKESLVRAIQDYERQFMARPYRVARQFAPQLEADAKQNAPWTDRTGQARQGLEGRATQLEPGVAAITLATLKDYGIWLEIANGGRYAIVIPTISAYYEEIRKALHGK